MIFNCGPLLNYLQIIHRNRFPICVIDLCNEKVPFIIYLINWCVTAVGFPWGHVAEVTSADDIFFGVKVEAVAGEGFSVGLC